MEYIDRKESRIQRALREEREQEGWNEVHKQLLAIQKKSIELNKPGDVDEKEADEVARKVVSGESAEIHETGGTINRKGEGTAETTPEFQSKLSRRKGSGQSLDASTKNEMESKMGVDFSDVKIHTGSESHAMNETVNAKAFTHGQDIYFNKNNSPADKELLAHELVHTVQQRNDKVQRKIQRQVANTPQPDFDELAKNIYNELNSTFSIDNVIIADNLKKLGNKNIYILALKEVYRRTYNIALEAELRGKLEGDDLKNDLALLTPSEDLGKIFIQGQWIQSTNEYKKATSFFDIVKLIRIAEDALISAGYTDLDSRIKVLRGIYYGTTWSMDYQQEKSETRNKGFDVYTASNSRPDDPQTILGASLFNALRNSPEVTDGDRKMDIGHLIIGLEARSKYTAREIKLPYQGGTGLEAVTWLGDLGGGTGMLAMKRVTNPQVKAKAIVFQENGNDYGARINLEGDIAAYVIGRNKDDEDDVEYPDINKYGYISDAIADYLLLKNGKTSDEWSHRVKNFALQIGAEFDDKNNITNKDDLTSDMSEKLMDFGGVYAVARWTSHNQLTEKNTYVASEHIKGAADEVAKIFVDMLENCAKDSSKKLVATLDPPATTKGEPQGILYSTAISLELKKQIEQKLKKK